jgi:glycosyltransferase involved in cell wall biosynthesis
MINIFVQRASECLTDHLPHGDGLICFSLLKGLAERGHRIFAYTNHNGVRNLVPNLIIRESKHRIPANGLADWEHSWRADRWLKDILRTERIDIIWRMHPYETGCPTVPSGSPRPLVVGPLFYSWPKTVPGHNGRLRLGIGLRSVVAPFAEAGWARTLKKASLVFCATEPHAQLVRKQTNARVEELPVIVDLPGRLRVPHDAFGQDRPLRLIFVANLLPHKHPLIFCETIRLLKDRGIPVRGTVVGDGSERAALQAWCVSNSVMEEIQFVGKIPNSEVLHQLADADILISASLGEPYGRSIVESMSAGTPAICHRSGGPADIIRGGVDGFLVDELQANSYADIAERLYRRPVLLHDASIAAQKRATAWTTGAIINQVENAFMQILGDAKA